MTRFTIHYREVVLTRDLAKIPRNMQGRILRAIEERLASHPGQYGQRLRKSLFGLWKLRVGDYRVVYEIQKDAVHVWLVCHRRDACKVMTQRWGGNP